MNNKAEYLAFRASPDPILPFDFHPASFYVSDEVANQPTKRSPSKPEVILTGPWGWFVKNLGIEAWGQILIIVLFAAAIPAGYLLWSVNNRITALETKIGDMPNDISDRMDAKLSDLRSDLIKEFLTDVKKSASEGNFNDAAASLRAAAILTNLQTQDHVESSPQFFQQVITELDRLGPFPSTNRLSMPVHRLRVALANYRSSLQPAPIFSKGKQSISEPIETGTISEILRDKPTVLWDGPPGIDMIQYPIFSDFSRMPRIHDMILSKGTQTLDNARWINMGFYRMNIRYNGGPVLLDHVAFVDCTFTVLPTPNSGAVIDYAALQKEFVRAS